MPANGQEVVYEGWLTKSPPTKRIWRARWRRRWFSLRHSGELPGQFHLTYYTDRNCRKLKGIIDLDHCEQVDLGLKHEERKLKFDHVFDIKTPTRTYYLAADSESEMKSWVNCICKVCGLKSTSDEEDLQRSINASSEIDVIEEESLSNDENRTVSGSPPLSPVSTSPYIPISECITGRSPIIEARDFETLLKYNLKNSVFRSDLPQNHSNDTYDLSQRTYLNYVNNEFDPRFYDCPRQLIPHHSVQNIDKKQHEIDINKDNTSPLQSPTDSESVFTDDDWIHNISSELDSSKNMRPSDSSADLDISVIQKFTKMIVDNVKSVEPPPRPPKPSHKTAPNYFNLSMTVVNNTNSKDLDDKKIVTDDMYDFPRSHNIESIDHSTQKHCYNNAAPVTVEGQIFHYDISPKPGTSTTLFKYDSEDTQDEPASPLSQSSSTTMYSNLPSPLLPDSQLMPPPIVNRDLKPKRKLSDSLSLSSNPEPSSPHFAPSVDRKLKPPTPLQGIVPRKTYETEEENVSRKFRAAPSPTPFSLGRSHESLVGSNQGDQEQIYHYLPGNKNMQYLDLDLEYSSSTQFSNNSTNSLPLRSVGANTVYKKVDFMKTEAFNITRNNLEKERKETVTYLKK